ncbi:MAG: alpha/beta hydrolase [Ilumatobacteraceae bacterium]
MTVTDHATAAAVRSITTSRGITSDVLVFGPDGAPPVVAFHGVGGHLGGEPTLAALGDGFQVFAPVWPGFGPDGGEERLEDMLDFALHAADVVVALGLERPHVYGHSFGGMVAAEMVALAPASYGSVALVAPAGVWIDEDPIPDIYAMLPYELPGYLFHDPAANAALLTGGVDFEDPEALKTFLIANSRRLGTAGKILFPIPNRRLSKRLYRVTNPVTLVWGASDRLIPPSYAARWRQLVPQADVVTIADAGHMAPYEQPAAVAKAVTTALTT